MANILLKVGELILEIQKCSDNDTSLKDHCLELQNLIDYIQKGSKYHYFLFLAEVYSTKLQEFDTAEALTRSVIQDARPSVSLQGTLHLCLINALQHKYENALRIVEQADTLSQKKQQLCAVFVDFCKRLMTCSTQSNLLNGLKCQHQQKYDEALKFYIAEYETSQHIRSQNQYFAAKAIIQLTSIFPNRSFNGINPQKCQNSLKQFYEQRGEHDYLGFIQQLQQNYLSQKNYLLKLIETMQKKEIGIETIRKIKGNSFSSVIKTYRLLGILKLKKLLKTEKQISLKLKWEFQKCLEQLIANKCQHFMLLNQFVSVQQKTINRVNQMFKKKLKQNLKYGFEKLMRKNQLSNQKPQQRSKKPNSKNLTMVLLPIKYKEQLLLNEQAIEDPKENKKQNINEQQNIDEFEGSYMIKINENSSGYQKRYFYLIRKQIQNKKLIIYYQKQKNNLLNYRYYYQLQYFTKLKQGKKTKALQRKQCIQFDQNKCFSITYGHNLNKNFYVPEEQDYRKWIQMLKKFYFQKQCIIKPTPVKNTYGPLRNRYQSLYQSCRQYFND